MNQYEVNSPTVVGEVIDGEAVIMDLASGYYFSSLGVGAAIWHCIELGCKKEIIASALSQRFPDAAPEIATDIDQFMDQLQQHGLIREVAVARQDAIVDDKILADISEYAVPNIQSYTDMQDLLLLDPVHEVDETGWPQAKK